MIVLMSGERQWMRLERRKRGRRRVIILATMGLYAGLGRWHICCSFHVFSVASFIAEGDGDHCCKFLAVSGTVLHSWSGTET